MAGDIEAKRQDIIETVCLRTRRRVLLIEGRVRGDNLLIERN